MRLLLVDDEEDTRKGIEKHIDWKKLGIGSVVSFSDSYAALAYIEKEKVDIVLSDIRIPQMDGIELCKNILERDSKVSIIFISGHTDKEYFKSAIQMSAVDYIEKPISISELEAAIERAVEWQLHARSLQRQQESAAEIIKKNQQMYLNQLAITLISGKDHAKNSEALDYAVTSRSESLPIPLNERDFYRIYVWRTRPYVTGILKKVQMIGAGLSASGMMNSFFIAQKDERTCLMISRFAFPLECCSQKIDLFLHKTLSREGMKQSLACAYGKLLQGFGNIRESYNQAVIALQNIFYKGYGVVLPYQENAEKLGDKPNLKKLLPDPGQLKHGLGQQKKEMCVAYLEQVYQVFREHTTILPDVIRNEYFKIYAAVNQSALELTEQNPQPEENASDYLWMQISAIETLEECHQHALEKIEQFFQNISSMMSDRKVILDVMRIIQQDYSDHELFIDQIAGQVYLTPNYLSTLFKKETGKTIGNYLTEVRLQQSVKLLTQTNMKLYDISRAVGYKDTNYFSKIFKKYYQMSPSEYRDRYALLNG